MHGTRRRAVMIRQPRDFPSHPEPSKLVLRPFRAATDRLRPKRRAPKARSNYSLPNASHLSPGLLLTDVRRQAKRSVISKIDVESALFTFIRAAGQLLTPPHLGPPLRWANLSLMFVGRHQFPYVATGQFTKPGRLPEARMPGGERHGIPRSESESIERRCGGAGSRRWPCLTPSVSRKPESPGPHLM